VLGGFTRLFHFASSRPREEILIKIDAGQLLNISETDVAFSCLFVLGFEFVKVVFPPFDQEYLTDGII